MSNPSDVHVEQVKAELLDLYELWFKALDNIDTSFVDRWMAPEFQYVSFLGEVEGVELYKKSWSTILPGYKGVHDIKEFDVRLLGHGTVALVTGIYDARMAFVDGSIVEEYLKFVSVWERDAGAWRMHHHQTVRFPRPHA